MSRGTTEAPWLGGGIACGGAEWLRKDPNICQTGLNSGQEGQRRVFVATESKDATQEHTGDGEPREGKRGERQHIVSISPGRAGQNWDAFPGNSGKPKPSSLSSLLPFLCRPAGHSWA